MNPTRIAAKVASASLALFLLSSCSDYQSTAPADPADPSPIAYAFDYPITWSEFEWAVDITDWYENYGPAKGGACSEAITQFFNKWTATYDSWTAHPDARYAWTDKNTHNIYTARDIWGLDAYEDLDTIFHEAWHSWYPGVPEESARNFAYTCLN